MACFFAPDLISLCFDSTVGILLVTVLHIKWEVFFIEKDLFFFETSKYIMCQMVHSHGLMSVPTHFMIWNILWTFPLVKGLLNFNLHLYEVYICFLSADNWKNIFLFMVCEIFAILVIYSPYVWDLNYRNISSGHTLRLYFNYQFHLT